MVDVRDIGHVAAVVLENTAKYINESYELTSLKKLSFYEMAKILSDGLNEHINYVSPSLINFYLEKRKEKTPAILILVMIMLHYFPRFQEEPAITDCIKKITGHEPISFKAFIIDNKKLFTYEKNTHH